MGEGARDNEWKGRDETGEEEEAMRREVSCGEARQVEEERLKEEWDEDGRKSETTGRRENGGRGQRNKNGKVTRLEEMFRGE